MTPPQGGANIASFMEEMRNSFKELKAMYQGFDERVRFVENREAACQPLIQSRLDAAFREIDKHREELAVLREMVSEMKDTISELKQTIVALKQSNATMQWLGGVLGTAVLVWIVTEVLKLI